VPKALRARRVNRLRIANRQAKNLIEENAFAVKTRQETDARLREMREDAEFLRLHYSITQGVPFKMTLKRAGLVSLAGASPSRPSH
jgi:hypothetical protein